MSASQLIKRVSLFTACLLLVALPFLMQVAFVYGPPELMKQNCMDGGTVIAFGPCLSAVILGLILLLYVLFTAL